MKKILIALSIIVVAGTVGLGIFNWYTGVPQMKHAAKICSLVDEKYRYSCYDYHKEQIPAYWFPKLFD